MTAIGGALLACIMSPLNSLVGGSGALFGLFGALFAIYARRGRHALDFLNYQGPRSLVSLLVLNLVLGFLIPGISNAAHIGGLVSGAALTFLFLTKSREPVDGTGIALRAGSVALFCSGLFYCLMPVDRADYLLDRWTNTQDQEERFRLLRGVHLLLQGGPVLPSTAKREATIYKRAIEGLTLGRTR